VNRSPDWVIGEPGSCRWCGINKQDHCQRWSRQLHELGENGWHGFVHPTEEQIKARMLKHRKESLTPRLRADRLPS
jgi:hypothetical protein